MSWENAAIHRPRLSFCILYDELKQRIVEFFSSLSKHFQFFFSAEIILMTQMGNKEKVFF